MPNRFTTAGRRRTYAALINQDGERCQKCGRKPTKKKPLEIDHKNHDPTNHCLTNLRLLCKSCNVTDSNRYRQLIKLQTPPPNGTPKNPSRRHALYADGAGPNASQNGGPSALCVCVKPHEQNGTDGAVLKEALGQNHA